MSGKDLESVDGHDDFLERSLQRTKRLNERLNNFDPDKVIKRNREERLGIVPSKNEVDLTSAIMLGEHGHKIVHSAEENFVVRFVKNVFSWAITLIVAQTLIFVTWLIYHEKFSIEFFNAKNFEFLKSVFISGINPKGSFLSKVEFASFMFMEIGFIAFAILSLIYFIFRRK